MLLLHNLESAMKFASLLTSLALTTGLAANNCEWVNNYIEVVPDFPIPGVRFRCYPELLKNPEAFHRVVRIFAERYREYNLDSIVGLDSRGFIFGAALAYEMNLPFVMCRKAGKLPRKCEKVEYALEYGKAAFEMEVDSIRSGERVLIIDDLLATGGTAAAAASLVERLGGEVAEIAFLIEMLGLNGRENLHYPIHALVSIE